MHYLYCFVIHPSQFTFSYYSKCTAYSVQQENIYFFFFCLSQLLLNSTNHSLYTSIIILSRKKKKMTHLTLKTFNKNMFVHEIH